MSSIRWLIGKSMSFVQSAMDRAYSVAKRHRAPRVEACHFLKVMYDIDREGVVALIGDHESEIEQAIYAAASESDRPDGVDPELQEVLEGVATEHKLRDRLTRIFELFSGESTPRLPVAPPSDTAATVAVAREPRTNFDHNLVAEIAGILNVDNASAQGAVSADLRHIAIRVAPDALPSLALELGDLMTVAPDEEREPFEVISLLCTTEQGASVARQVCLAYVGVAFFCASIDDVVTEAEVDEIDAIRLELRSALSKEALGRSTIDDVFERHFSDLVGLEEVKQELRHRLDFFLISRLRRERGMPIGEQSLHMAFLGNPGTGKTHVARRFAAALRDLEVLSRGHLVEVDRSGLVGQYVGHTEKKVSDVVDSAIGGVLFVDEAYALSDGSLNGGYGDEAIDVLVKRLEDDRADLLAILAGYRDQMEEFLDRNPGLRSRIPGVLVFPDYSVDELAAVATSMASENGYRFDEKALDVLSQAVEAMRGGPEFGNARTVRNIFERAVRQQFARLAPLGDLATDEEQRLLTADDIPQPERPRADRTIGFQRVLDQ